MLTAGRGQRARSGAAFYGRECDLARALLAWAEKVDAEKLTRGR